MGSIKCSNINEEDVKKIESIVKTRLSKLGLNRGKLTLAEVSAVLTNLATSKNITIEALLSPENKLLVGNTIAESRNKKDRERKALETTKIGTASVSIGKKVSKKDPQNNRDILYVHEESLQAYKELAPEGENIYSTTIIKPKGGVKLNIIDENTSSKLRTDTNGEKNRNASGIVIKKNAQGKDGKFLKDSGNFEDTEEDFIAFYEVNKKVIKGIKEALNNAENKYKEVIFDENIAMDKAGLPRRFAEALQKLLLEELNISSMILNSSFKEGFYGLELQSFGKSKSGKTKSQAIKEEKAKKQKEEALESLKAERPILSTDELKQDVASRSILSRTFPNIEERTAIVSFLSTLFSNILTNTITKTKNQLNSITGNDLDNLDSSLLYLREGLNKGTEAEQRVFALENINIKGRSLIDHILNNIINQMQTIVDIEKDLNSEDPEIVNKGIQDMNVIMNTDNWISREFKLEAAQHRSYGGNRAKAWEGANLTKQQIKRIKDLAEEFGIILNTKGIFSALIKEISFELEFNENIRIDADSIDVENYTIQRTTVEEETETEGEEGSSDNRSGLNLVKYKLLDPAKTLSIRMKTMLAGLYKMKNGEFVFDKLGQRVRMNPTLAYYILLDEFSKMNKSEDLETYIQKVVKKYPWFELLAEKLNADRDLKNEFYTAFRKVFVTYGSISKRGFITKLNRNNNSETFLEVIRRAYEGRQVFNEDSIYDDSGECVKSKVRKINALCIAKDGGVAKNKKEHPFYWAKQVLAGKGSLHSVDNMLEVIDILSGESEEHPNISLEKLLNSIGVDTSHIDMTELLPYIDKNELNEAIEEGKASGKSELEVFETFFTKDQQKRINDIIGSIITITKPEKGFLPGDHLIDKFQSAYLQIGSSLTLASEAYTLATFRYGTQSRFSFAAPDFISIFIGTISNMEDIEYGTKYIEENYGQFDFFRNQRTKEWYNTWMEYLYTPGSNGDYSARKNLEYINILGFDGKVGKDTIGKVNKTVFKEGLITAMFSAQKDSHGNKYGYFRNPLFSDTDALVLVKMPRFSGPSFEEDVIKKLALNLDQEIERIIAIRSKKQKDLIVDFYNDKRSNGAKFCFFPEFNPILENILDDLNILAINDEVSYEDAKRNYLEGLIKDFIEAKFQKFLNNFDLKSKERIYSKITSIEKSLNEDSEDTKETSEDLEYDDTRSDDEAKTAEELSAEKEKAIDEVLKEFYYNDFFGQLQFMQILGGDLAYFKNYDDFVKRCKEAYACGERLFGLETDEEGNVKTDSKGNAVKLTETCLYLEDANMISNTFDSIKKLLLSKEDKDVAPMEKAMLRGAINMFKDICSTDGQSLRSIHSFRKIFKAMGGKWTNEMERAYNNLRNGNVIVTDVIALLTAIKPFYVGYESKKINGRNEKIGVQYKNSEYLISSIYSILNTALNKSPELVALNQFMEDNNIDVVHFRSVVKHGGHSFVDINYDKERFYKDLTLNKGKVIINNKEYEVSSFENYNDLLIKLLDKEDITQSQFNEALLKYRYKTAKDVYNSLEKQVKEKTEENAFHIMPLEDMMLVQPNSDHLIGPGDNGEYAVLGSQAKNIIPADLPEDFKLKIRIGNEDIIIDNREEAVLFYNTLLTDNLIDAFDSVESEFSNIKALKSALETKMRGNPRYGDDVKEAIKILEDGSDFVLPLNSPNLSNKIEELLLSSFKNKIQRQMIKGGNVVLVSNFGLSDDLKVKYHNDDSTKGIEYIPAYMPAYMRTMYEDYLIEKNDGKHSYWVIDFDKLKEENEEDLLNIIGYRIPTEDKYSMLPIKIVGFMPTMAGSTITLPSDIVTMSGTDFDIDKLFLMIRTVRREVFGTDLSKKFKSWRKEKRRLQEKASIGSTAIMNEKALKLFKESATEEESPEEEKIINSILYHKTGFTDKEIEFYKNKSPKFKQFMDEEGEDYRREFPKYVVKRTSLKRTPEGKMDLNATSLMSDIYSQNERKDIRDNMIIDIMWGVLTSPEGSKLSMLPGSFVNVKIGSRQQRIMHDREALVQFKINYSESIKEKGFWETILGLSLDELDTFYEKHATPVSPMDIDDYVNKHQNLMDGNDLIGMLAVNSSSHYKYQFLDLKLHKNNQFFVQFPGSEPVYITDIDNQNSPITGLRIGRVCSEFQAASPDNGKDPCLGDLGANSNTIGRISALIRLGFDPQTIGVLNTADDLRAVATSDVRKTLKPDDVFDGNISKVVDLLVKLRTEGLDDVNDIKEAAKFAIWMDNIDLIAQTLKASNVVSRADSVNGALAINSAEVVQQILKAEDFKKLATDPNCPIIGLDALVDIDLDATTMSRGELRSKLLQAKIPRHQAAYTLGIKSAITLSSSYLIQQNKNVINAVRMLRNETKNSFLRKTDIPNLKKFFSELTMFLLSKNSIFGTDAEGDTIIDKRNYYIHDFPMKMKAFLDAKDDKGRYIHQDIRDLTFIQRLTNGHETGISFRNVGKISTISRKHYSEALESMLFHPDKEVKDLAMDLMMYSYYDNGLNFGHSNFGIFFTTSALLAIPRFMDVLRANNGEMVSDSEVIKNYTYQFLLNHPDMIPFLKSNYYKKGLEGNSLIVSKDDLNKVRSGIDGTGDYLKFIMTSNGVYELQSKDIVSDGRIRGLRYVKVNYNKFGVTKTKNLADKTNKTNYTPLYDATVGYNEIVFDDMQKRGAVVKIEETKKENSEEKIVPSEKGEPNNIPTEKQEPTKIPKDIDEPSGSIDEQDFEEEMANKGAKLLEDDSRGDSEEAEAIIQGLARIEQKQDPELYNVTEREEPSNLSLDSLEDTSDPEIKICKK